MERKWIKTSYDKQKGKRDRGAALIVAIIIMAVVIIFTFSLMLVSYTYYASQSKNVASKRCSEAANTLSQALEEDVTSAYAPYYSSIWKYVRFNLFQKDTWPYYKTGVSGHGAKEAFRYFDLNYNKGSGLSYSSVEGFPGEIELCMYWTPADTVDLDDNSGALYDQDQLAKNGAILYIEITCSAGSQSYTILNSYKLKQGYFGTSEADVLLKNSLVSDVGSAYYNPLKCTIDTVTKPEKWTWTFLSRE